MTVGSGSHDRGLPVQALEEYQARERLLEAELAGVRAAIEAIRSFCHSSEDGGFWRDLHLDGLQTTDAIVAALSYAEKHGKPELSIGEIETVLKRYDVTTSRRQGRRLFRDSNKPLVALGQALRGYKTRDLFQVGREHGERLQRGDMVRLAAPGKP